MSDIIKKLSIITSNQITAGEVVKRPSSVVKELMENSIDAGSTLIQVNVKDGGKEFIQVIDNGVGMSFNDAFSAFERHATSKIFETEDLYKLSTFGFRGEALPSIASVSEVELKTCREEDELGTMIAISGGELQKHVKVVVDKKGTQIMVKNLFMNLPQRRKFLAKPKSEMTDIVKEFIKVALCNPDIDMMLYSNSKLLYNFPYGTIKQRVGSILGKSLKDKLMEVNIETSLVSIKGYVGTPEIAVKRPEQFMFVNGRYFKSSYFNKAVKRAFEKMFTDAETSPRYFLYFTVTPSEIDVNADPEKVDVRFENEQQIWQILFSALRGVLGKNGFTPTIDFEVSSDISFEGDDNSFKSMVVQDRREEEFNPFNENFSFSKAVYGCEDDQPSIGSVMLDSVSDVAVSTFSSAQFSESITDSEVKAMDTVSSSIASMGFRGESVDDLINNFENSSAEVFSSSFEFEQRKSPDEEEHGVFSSVSFGADVQKKTYDITMLGRCSFFANKYIVAPFDNKILFIKVLSALNRISYDRYFKMIEKKTVGAVNKLIFPVTIPLSVTHRATIDQCRSDLESLGFGFEESETDGAIDIVGIPTDYDKYNLYEVFEEILEYVSGDDIEGYNEQKREMLIHRLSSAEATRRAKLINVEDYDLIVRELFMCENFKTSPNGRPIFAELVQSNIDNLLK